MKVVIDDVSEAFQFFDSQNARGKDLEPHDLLKAYHLREMNRTSTEQERLDTVREWENMEPGKLSDLFSQYLYRIKIGAEFVLLGTSQRMMLIHSKE